MLKQNKKLALFFAFLSGISTFVGIIPTYKTPNFLGLAVVFAISAIIIAIPDNKE